MKKYFLANMPILDETTPLRFTNIFFHPTIDSVKNIINPIRAVIPEISQNLITIFGSGQPIASK